VFLDCIFASFLQPLLRTPPSPFTTRLVNKLLAFGYGLACIGLAFVAAQLKGVLQASLTVFGVVGGPLLGLFTVGMMLPFVSQRAAVPSFLIALIFGFWIGFGGPKPPVVPLSRDTSECGAFESEEFPCRPQFDNSTSPLL